MAEGIKVRMLLASYPLYDAEVLVELLHSCEGSVEKTRHLLEGYASHKKRRKLDETKDITSDSDVGEHETRVPELAAQSSPRKGNWKYQSSITPLMKKPKPSKVMFDSDTNAPKIIKIYTPEQVQQYLGTYVDVYKNFLPEDLAASVLDYLMQPEVRTKSKPAEFHLFENDCVSLHSTLVAHSKRSPEKLFHDRLVYNGKSRIAATYNDDMERASLLVSNFINEQVIPKNKRLPFQSRERWDGTYTVINYYHNLQSHLDYHSDRLSHIGPHCYIASLLLGATRQFRMRRNYGKEAATQYYLELPHNCLVVMKPGCQEEYRHSINSMKNAIQLHPKYGSERINLTFRCYSSDYILRIPKCKCDLTMTLRRAFKTVETRGKYFWSCENSYQNKDCGTFHWANFENLKGNLIANTEDQASIWIAKDDTEKLKWVQRLLTMSKRITKNKINQPQARSF